MGRPNVTILGGMILGGDQVEGALPFVKEASLQAAKQGSRLPLLHLSGQQESGKQRVVLTRHQSSISQPPEPGRMNFCSL